MLIQELAAGLKSYWNVEDNTIYCTENDSNGRKLPPYSFDRVFSDSCVTMDIFEDVCKPIVDSALAGFNGTLFAYGQSSSGKTFTMSGSKLHPGIISLAVDEIFSTIENIPDREFLIRVGYLEIYKEKVSDLLSTENVNLKLQEDTDRNLQVVGLTEELVKNTDNVFQVLKRGDANRHTAETKQNDRSSRSHCILRFVIESRKVGHEDDAVMVSNLYFVDLAGSEKAGENSGDRFREGCSINKSLFTLGMVIRKLSGDLNQQHVSFRDSKLTRILQNALGGNSRTAIICTITPAHIDESDSTLKFASRAKNITNKPTVNEVMSDAAMLKQYRLKMMKMEQQIAALNTASISIEKAELEKQLEEKDKIERQQADMIAKLQEMIVISGTPQISQEPPKKKRRETWCPGKAKASLQALPEFSPPHFKSYLSDKLQQQQTILEEDEDSFQLLENIPVPSSNDFNKQNNTQTVDESMCVNPSVKELFELQDKHEILIQELKQKDAEFVQLEEFTKLERLMEAEQIEQLKTDLKKKVEEHEALKSNLPWLEEELMKAQQERNNLRLKVESLNAKLNSVEDGTGITQISEQLTHSETQVNDLNNDLQIQKSQYEFHIKQMKLKLETYTTLLEEKGVDIEMIKTRLSSNGVNDSTEPLKVEDNEITELKAKHEKEIGELRNEVDLKVIAIESEKKKADELKEQFDDELERQRKLYLQDIEDAREESQVYLRMLEEEKKKSQTNVTVNTVDDESKNEINEIKNKYEEDISRLNIELLKYQDMCKELQLNEQTQSTCNTADIDKVKEQFEGQITSLQSEVRKYQSLYENAQVKITSRSQQSFDCSVDDETVGLNLPDFNVQNDINNELGTDLHKEMMQAEIEKLKENHEQEINDLKAELAKYSDVVRDSGMDVDTDIQVKELQEEMMKMKHDHEAEVEKLQTEIAHIEMSTKMNKVNTELQHRETQTESDSVKACDEITDSMSVNDQINDMRQQHEMEVANLKEEIYMYASKLEQYESNQSNDLQSELMQAELNKMKERHEMEVTELSQQISKYEELLKGNKMEGCTELQVELDKIKESHNSEVTQLKAEITKYVDMIEQNSSHTEGSLGLEIMQAEINKLKEQHEVELMELKDQIAKYAGMVKTDNKDVDVDMEYDADSSDVCKLKESHAVEIAKLNEEIARYAKLLDEKSIKIEKLSVKRNKKVSFSDNIVTSLHDGNYIEDDTESANISEKLSSINESIEDEDTDKKVDRGDIDDVFTDKHDNVVTSDNNVNMQYEMKIADQEAELKHCHDEINELKCKLSSLTECLEKEREKVENGSASVDEKIQEMDETVNIKKENERNDESKFEVEIKDVDTNSIKVEKQVVRFVDEISLKEEIENISSMSDDKNIDGQGEIKPGNDDDVENEEDIEMLRSKMRELEENHAKELEDMKMRFETFLGENFETKQAHEEMKNNYEDLVETLKIELEEIKNQLLKLQYKHATAVSKAGVNVVEDKQSSDVVEANGDGMSTHKEISTNTSMVMEQMNVEKECIDISINTSIVNIEEVDTDDMKKLQLIIEEKEKYLQDLQQRFDDAKILWNEEKQEADQLMEKKEESLQEFVENMKMMEDKNSMLENQIKTLEDELQSTVEENSVLESRINELEHHIRIGKGMLEDKDDEIKTLKDNMEYMKDELEKDVQEKIEEMTTYVNELEQKYDSNEDALRSANEKIDEFEQSEVQFSDKIVALESDIELFKENEATLNKMCTDYEEKIVLLEADLDTMKTRTSDYDRLCTDLEIAQSNNLDVKIIQDQYNEQIQDYITKLADSETQCKTLTSKNDNCCKQLETVSSELDGANKMVEELKTELDHLKREKDELLLNQNNLQETSDKLKQSEEKLEMYVETIKELNEQIKITEDDVTVLQSKILGLEDDNKTLSDTVRDVDELKIKIDSLETEVCDKSNIITLNEAEIKSLQEKLMLAEASNSTVSESELADVRIKVKEADDKILEIQSEKYKLSNDLENLNTEKVQLEKRVEDLEEEKCSLEDDIVVLEKGLPAQPENIDWENKWETFVREEKKKRLAYSCTIKGLKKDLDIAQEKQKNAYQEALKSVNESEQEKEVYKKMEAKIKKLDEEANTIYYKLEDEKEKNKTLTEKLNKLESEQSTGPSSHTKINTLTDDHSCKYKLEAFSAKENMIEIQEELKKRVNQYESTINQYEDRIAHMKNQIRRLQSNMNDSINVCSSTRKLNFDTEVKEEKPVSSKPVSESRSTSTSVPESRSRPVSESRSISVHEGSTNAGYIDHFKVAMTQAENKDLKKEVEKMKQKSLRYDDVEKENKILKQNLEKMRLTYPHSNQIEKENICLKQELEKLKSLTKKPEPLNETTLSTSKDSRLTFDDVFRKSRPDSVASPSKEALFNDVFKKSQKQKDTKERDETPNCQTS
ncbi:hypothetical protein ACF0H5_005201 [Mactra antiquata]